MESKSFSIKEIISGLLNYADTFSFVVREGITLSKTAVGLIEGLNSYLIEEKKVSDWPGTRLLWEKASLFNYYLKDESAHILYASEDDLFKWVFPYHPEDLVLYKENSAIFVSITHEKDAYFELENSDEGILRDKNLF